MTSAPEVTHGPANASPSRAPQPVFVAFAGGGAKGLVHVGALKALETKNVEFSGVSGTSAGAIVAALKAAGFTADDMADPAAGTTILEKLVLIDPQLATAPDLFGPGGWARVDGLRRLLRCGPRRLAVAAGLSIMWLLLCSFIVASSAGPGWAFVIWLFWMAGLSVVARWAWRILVGLSGLERFRTALGTLLSEKAFPGEIGRVVKMRDFGRAGLLPLKIVGANLSTRQLKLFSAETTPDVSVADTVAASISIPIVFRPQHIGPETFVDGGIVSNLPAWPFDEERELDPDAITLAFEIADTPPVVELLEGLSWLPAAIRTAVFGSGVLNLRAVGRSELIELRTDLDLLDFDLGKEAALKQVAESRIAADVELEMRLFTRPELYRRACEVMVETVERILDGIPVAAKLPSGERRVRVSLAMSDDGHARSVRLRYGAGYRDDLDERLLLPLDSSVVGRAWRTGIECFVTRPFDPLLSLPGRVNRYRRQQVWNGMEWVLCVPIFSDDAAEDEAPAFVVSIDCNELPAAEILPSFRDLVAELAVDSFGQLLLQLEQIGASA
jgi:NTE family protein